MTINQTTYKHVISADMVGLSKPGLSVEVQVKKIEILHKIVSDCETFRNIPKEKISYKPEGDGFIISVTEYPTFPIELAIELQKKIHESNQNLDESNKIRIRMGIHSGIMQKVAAVVEDEYGDAFVGVTRVMSMGDEDHILLSEKTAKELIQLSEKYKDILHYIGEYLDKHEIVYSLYSAYGECFGNPVPPLKK